MKNFLFLLFISFPFLIGAQNVTVKITLNVIEGGVHSNMNVTLVDLATGAKYSGKTGADGKVAIQVPPNASYEVKIPNYTAKKIINVPNAPGATMTSSMSYSRDMVAKDAAFAMNDAEKAEIDNFVKGLPDTTWFKGGNPFKDYSNTYYASFELGITDFDKGPLEGEIVTLVGRKNKKAFKAVTGANGEVTMWLPKGDDYDLSFYYHKNYEYNECKYSKGTSEIRWEFSYIGTKAYKKIKDEEERRLAEEKKRLEEERKAFLAYCKAHKVSEEEGMKLKLKEEMATTYGGSTDLAVQNALDRNKFQNPLIVTDVTGSMSPYMAQLQAWFKINAPKNPTAQFVFFNDGDNKSDGAKVIGNTGGIYYTPSVPVDQLLNFMSMASSKGNGGDGPENNMEALIKGTKMATKPFTDIVMVADNNAPVKDISLLGSFTKPVHIIVCGSNGNFVHPDYLEIAWKTKGSIHTADADYTNIGNLKDGETIKIGLSVYRLMKGEFIKI